jgi:hypothetical protein
MTISLNGFRVELSSPQLTARVLNVPFPHDMKRLRNAHGKEWFFHWRGGKAYALPRLLSPATVVARSSSWNPATTITCTSSLHA